MEKRIKSLGVVLKTVERCNIDCTYCYMFNMGDETYLKRPIYISNETIEAVAEFLRQGCLSLKIQHLIIEIHGGEPLMQNKNEFDLMCSHFQTQLSDVVQLEFAMQTNGMLLDDDWLHLIRKHKVGFGISLDGPKEYHDKYRIDKLNKGTYERVISKLNYVRSSNIMQGFTHKVGILSVVNPEFDARIIYRHFVDDLKLTHFDFLTPFCTHHHQLDYPVEAYGKFLCDLFDEWTKDNNPEIEIRYLRSVINGFFGQDSLIYGVGPSNINDLPLISIASNGELSPTDELRTTDESVMYSGATVFNTSLNDYLQAPIFEKIRYAQSNLPDKCLDCCWQKICSGGAIVNRYHRDNDFNNPSIFCNGLKMFYRQIALYLTDNGYNHDDIAKMLGINTPKIAA